MLIANRGEIALRVARTCKEMGLRTVAVYSTEDSDTPVVWTADEAVHIGPGPAARSYLSIPAIMEAALRTGADAIHPGYGFLSEDHDFAEVCESSGIALVGTPASVLASLSDKSSARAIMADAGLPLLPGSVCRVDTVAEAKQIADRIGYPVIIKAVAGGGGRGMRIVDEPGGFHRAYRDTRAAARAVFGDSGVYVERYLPSARHVEVQVLGDRHGNVIHVGERDCSVQRRHQKIIEESPAPRLPAEVAARIRDAAVHGARAAGYVGAGTFEFVVDADTCEFYFMEVNCRIQVEHPVTEMVSGLDLVREQITIADGSPLSLAQDDVVLTGCAIECRVNAEDPGNGFRPAPGVLEEFRVPAGPFVRVDTHGFAGCRVTPSYDSLLAKAIVWAPDRPRAIARMTRALDEFRVTGPGVHTTVGFLRDVITNPVFGRAEHDTTFAERLLAGRDIA
ncbi:MAG TPA: biotin carboxylase N-terminal domain-containing protein [Streptosporangiaceae bacterium]|nr:biotin carboxylase N-terminal domain-containing protein [Streptosporangiaceae bacterium]